MKEFLKSLRPNSLFGQLLLVTLVGAALLQCVNFFAVYSIQKSYSREFLNLGHDYIGAVYQAVRRMDETQRSAYIADVANARSLLDKPFRFRVLQTEPDWSTQDYYKSVGIHEALQHAIEAAGSRISERASSRTHRRRPPTPTIARISSRCCRS